jgi:glycosyltransferase involved in cell wall biosynthesis
MKFSIIVPSYNQDKYIGYTLSNLKQLKERAAKFDVEIEVLVFDSESNAGVQAAIEEYRSIIDVLEVKKDKGQYDAINKGISACTGDYWTWLNTDDLLDLEGFEKAVKILRNDPSIDYIYGSIDYIDDKGNKTRTIPAYELTLHKLVHDNPSVFQPGSFFKKSFTDKIGLLGTYRCCFDYEYILRCLKNGAKFYKCDFTLAEFRYYEDSKTGSIIPVFLREQLSISKQYGRHLFSFNTGFLSLRQLKHKLFPRR